MYLCFCVFEFHQALDKSSRLSEKELAEAASRWAAEKGEKTDTSNLPEISEYDVSGVKILINFDP